MSRTAFGLSWSSIHWVPWALSWGVKWPGLGAARSPLSGAEVKSEWVLPWFKRLFAWPLSQKPGFNPMPVCVGSAVNRVALGQVFLGALQFFRCHHLPVRQALSFVRHGRYIIIPTDSEINKTRTSGDVPPPRVHSWRA